MLIAQELTYYGLDIYKKRISPTVRPLADVEGFEWIRLHYAFPSKFPLEILDAMGDRPKICNYLDMPLQTFGAKCSKHAPANYQDRDAGSARHRARQSARHFTAHHLPRRYPGETEEDFEELIDFLRQQRFDRVGVFPIFDEESTRAYELPDDVPAEIKAERTRTDGSAAGNFL